MGICDLDRLLVSLKIRISVLPSRKMIVLLVGEPNHFLLTSIDKQVVLEFLRLEELWLSLVVIIED